MVTSLLWGRVMRVLRFSAALKRTVPAAGKGWAKFPPLVNHGFAASVSPRFLHKDASASRVNR